MASQSRSADLLLTETSVTKRSIFGVAVMNSFQDFDRSLLARSGFIRAALTLACLTLSANALAANLPLISSASLKCAAPYGNASRGTQVVQTACGGGTAQQWK